MLDEDAIDELGAAGVDEVKVRTASPVKPVLACVPSATGVIWAVAAW